jgi:hypothetical protein
MRGQVLRRLAPGKRRQHVGVRVQERGDAPGVDVGVLAQRPADALAQEEVRITGAGETAAEKPVAGTAAIADRVAARRGGAATPRKTRRLRM